MLARISLALILMLALPAAAAADFMDDRSYPVQAGYKLVRGLTNIVTSPFEIPYNSVKEAQNVAEDSTSFAEMSGGAIVGVFTGLAYTVTRIGVGVFDTVTFPWVTEPVMYPRITPSVLELALNGGLDNQ